jgi:hypothetical protein
MARPTLRCTDCKRRPRMKGRTRCRVCYSKLHKAAAVTTWKRRKVRARIAREAQGEAIPGARAPTPAEMRQLIADCDAAAERALNLALSLAKK